MVEMERLDGVVGSNPMAGGLGAQTGTVRGLVRKKTTAAVRRLDEGVVLQFRDYEV
jgi:hypothetical protein